MNPEPLDAELSAARARVKALEAELEAAQAELETHRKSSREMAEALSAAQQLATELSKGATGRHNQIEEAIKARLDEIEGPARARASATLAEAEAAAAMTLREADSHAAKVREEASQEAVKLRAELAELLRLREDLVSTMREVIRDFAQSIGRVDRGETPVPTALSAPLMASLEPSDAEGDEGDAGAEATGPGEQIELNVGPLADFAAVSAMEGALAALPNVRESYVRRFSGERVLIELRLAPGASAKEEIESLPYPLASVKQGKDGLKVDLKAPAPASGR